MSKTSKQSTTVDWTVDPDTGRSNASPAFREASDHVERLIRGDAHFLISGNAQITARLIVAQLAHKFGMAPTSNQDSGPTTHGRECPCSPCRAEDWDAIEAGLSP